jgi:hypothetical protein
MEFKGYDLFYDVEDQDLKTRNRAVVLWNIYESNTENGATRPGGVADMVGYMKEIPAAEQRPVLDKLSSFIELGGVA